MNVSLSFACFLTCSMCVGVWQEMREIDVVVKYVEEKRWKSVLILTDHNKTRDISKRFSQKFIYTTLITIRSDVSIDSLRTFFYQRSEHQIIVFCASHCIGNFVKYRIDFARNYHWLFVYDTQDNFSYESKFVNDSIRVDSDVSAVITTSNPPVLISFKYKKPLEITPLSQIKDEFLHTKQRLNNILAGITIKATVYNKWPIAFVMRYKSGSCIVQSTRHHILLFIAKYLGLSIEYDAITYTGNLTYQFREVEVELYKLRRNLVDISGVGMELTSANLLNTAHSLHFHTQHTVVTLNNLQHNSHDEDNDFSAYFHPFSKSVWCCLICLLCIALILSFFATYGHMVPRHQLPVVLTWYNWINNYIMEYLLIFPAQGLNWIKTNLMAKKILVTVIFLFLYCVMAFYNSDLISSLAAESHEFPYKTLSDLVEDGRFTFGTVNNSPEHQLIMSAHSGLYRIIRESKPVDLVSKSVDGYAKLQNTTNYAVFSPCEFDDPKLSLNPYFKYLEDKNFYIEWAFFFPKNSPYVEYFSRAITYIRSVGILSKENKICPLLSKTDDTQEEFEGVHFHRVKSLIFVFIFGILWSQAVLLLELVIAKCYAI